MFLIAWVVVGLLSGVIVSKVVHRQEPAFVSDTLLGIFGALVGGFLFNVVSGGGVLQFNAWSLVCAGMGSLLMLSTFHSLGRVGHGFH